MKEELESSEAVIEKFSDANLVPHGYLDSSLPSFESNSQLAELHSQTSNLLSQLDHHSQDLTWKLENLTGELLRASTRVSYEIEILKTDVSGLVTEVDELSTPKIRKLQEIENQNDTIKQLQKLVKVKERMIEVQNVFEEAKKFDENKILENIDKLIENESYDSAFEKIGSLEKLCLIWKGTNIYTSRMKFINKLKKRVNEAKSGPTVTTSTPTQQQSPAPDSSSPRVATLEASNSRSSTPTESYGFFGQLSKRMGY